MSMVEVLEVLSPLECYLPDIGRNIPRQSSRLFVLERYFHVESSGCRDKGPLVLGIELGE